MTGFYIPRKPAFPGLPSAYNTSEKSGIFLRLISLLLHAKYQSYQQYNPPCKLLYPVQIAD